MMDHLSCLGPIDPQIEKDGKLVPALSYLNQYERLNKKAQEGVLTAADWPEEFPTEAAQARERKRLHEVIAEMVQWKASGNRHVMGKA